MPRITEIHVNGAVVKVDADAERSLLSVLREDLDLTGCKYGCGEGQCGACTVLLDGVAARSCTTPLGDVGAREITTIESLERDGKLHPVQQAFLDSDALQCGYCTSGMILGTVALLKKHSLPNDEEILLGMNGHLCRCGAYPRILAAIRRAAAAISQETP